MIGKFLMGTALGGLVGLGAVMIAVKIAEVPQDEAALNSDLNSGLESEQLPISATDDKLALPIEPETLAEAQAEALAGAEAQVAVEPDAAEAPSIEADATAVAPLSDPLVEPLKQGPLASEIVPEMPMVQGPAVQGPMAQEPRVQAPEPFGPMPPELPTLSSELAPSVPAGPEDQTLPNMALSGPTIAAPLAAEAPPTQLEELFSEPLDLPALTPEEKALLAEMAMAALAGEAAQRADDPSQENPTVAPSPQTLPAVPPEAAAQDIRVTPLIQFAQAFDNPSQKPLFSVVLIDSGEEGLDRQSLADLPLSVSFALNPDLPKAADYAAIYRAAGREVIMLLPDGTQPEDLERYAQILPQAIGVMESGRRQFQADRAKSEAFVPLIVDQGRGLLTWESENNLADQLAKREGLPSAMIFRPLDSDDEAVTVIRRYLDRAAYKADNDGSVVVLGQTRPETIQALIEWSIEGRSANVSLAPLSAVLQAGPDLKP